MTAYEAEAPGRRHLWTDRAGVLAASACAVHCMAAPVVLAFAPLIGGVWASPRTHWAFAAVSIPAAISLLVRKVRHEARGRRRALIGLATVGALLVTVGLAAPGAAWSQGLGVTLPVPDWAPAAIGGSSHECVDECCASVHGSADGGRSMFVPIASLVTMAGGLLLVSAHVMALRGGRCCPDGPAHAS